jgi:hypothetical protein
MHQQWSAQLEAFEAQKGEAQEPPELTCMDAPPHNMRNIDDTPSLAPSPGRAVAYSYWIFDAT